MRCFYCVSGRKKIVKTGRHVLFGYNNKKPSRDFPGWFLQLKQETILNRLINACVFMP
jgi:hypothetical protein